MPSVPVHLVWHPQQKPGAGVMSTNRRSQRHGQRRGTRSFWLSWNSTRTWTLQCCWVGHMHWASCSLIPGQKGKTSFRRSFCIFLGQGLTDEKMLLWLICNIPQDNDNTYNREALAGCLPTAGSRWGVTWNQHYKDYYSQIVACRTQSSAHLQTMTKEKHKPGEQVYYIKLIEGACFLQGEKLKGWWV